jgi:hypothetical protein
VVAARDIDLLPMFGLGVQQKSRTSTAQRRVNLYYEMQKDPDRSVMVAYGTPGLTLFLSFGDTPVRGWCAPPVSTYFFVVHRGTFWQVDNAGVKTSRGSLSTTTGSVSMAFDGRYVIVVDGTAGYTYDMNTPANPLAVISDSDFPNGATTATWQDSYFIVNKGTNFYLSAPSDPTAWNAADVATAEANPDNLIRVEADHQELVLFGDISVEFWSDTGAADFPYERVPGAALEWGLAAVQSVSKFDDALMFLAQNRLGQVIAAQLRSYSVARVSNHDLENRWASYGAFSDAVSYSYMLDGHPMYVVHFPTGGETWLYDGSTGGWSQLKSYGLTRHRTNLGLAYLGRTLASDYSNGNVYRLDASSYTDNGDPIIREIVGKHIFQGFRKQRVDAFQLDIETGVGVASGQGSDPQAMLRISKDGGRTWGNERWESFGAVGEYMKRCLWKRCGRARNFTFWVQISDPVKVAIMGAGIKPGNS